MIDARLLRPPFKTREPTRTSLAGGIHCSLFILLKGLATVHPPSINIHVEWRGISIAYISGRRTRRLRTSVFILMDNFDTGGTDWVFKPAA